jgi:signal peptidase I
MPVQSKEFMNCMAPAIQKRETMKLELAAEVLRSSGEVQFVARGASMVPAIFPGDVLLVRHEPMAAMRPGDVALWSRDARFCAHRVLQIANINGKDVITTSGDALRHQDAPVRDDEFLGRVYAIVRRGKRIDIAQPPSLAQRAVACLAQRSDSLTKWLLRYNSLMWRLARRKSSCAPPELVPCELLECP